jgi:hypothetical protein
MTKTEHAVRNQLRAMNADLYEVGCLQQNCPVGAGERTGQTMLLRTWDTDTLTHSLGWLAHQNAHDCNIYVRPYGEHHLSMVDDLSRQSVEQMAKTGYHPAVVVQTSPGNYQAWLDHGRKLPTEVSTAAARELAERFGGDRKAADWRHFGRLAGFTNRKDQHKREDGSSPWVLLIEARGGSYERADELTAQAEHAVARRHQEAVELARRYAQTKQPSVLRTIDEFRNNPRYAGDGHRIDMAYAVYALSHGMARDQVASAIASRDLSKKGGPRQQIAYIDHTINKALAQIGRGQERELAR